MRGALQYWLISVSLTGSVACDNAEVPAPKTLPVQPPAGGEVRMIDPGSLEVGPIRHGTLAPELLKRIEKVHAVFAELQETSLDKWVEDFRRDLDPEPNVGIWEDMAEAYLGTIGGRQLSLATRQELFKVVLMRSMMSSEETLARVKLKSLTAEDARLALELYPSPPKPIDVVEVE